LKASFGLADRKIGFWRLRIKIHMQTNEIQSKEKTKWGKFIIENNGSFLQSWEWAEFRAVQNNKIYRFAVIEEEKWVAACFCYKSNLKFGQSIFNVPRGPIFSISLSKEKQAQALKMIIDHINQIVKSEKVMSLQIDIESNDSGFCKIFDEQGFVKMNDDNQPRHTLILNLEQEKEALLKNMHQKTRYNINLAKKKGVEIIVDNNRFKEFHELMKKTNARHEISTFADHYFEKILAIPFVKLYLAKYDNKVIAANIMVFYNGTATYLFGASDYEYRKIMAPHLLQWSAICNAKEQGLKKYDFWGAAPQDASGRETNWGGFTRFKRGFLLDAKLTEYLGTYEKQYLPVKLGIYRFAQKIFKKK